MFNVSTTTLLNAFPDRYELRSHFSFHVWQGCLCDEGYEGHDCVLRSCPFGDDPDTHSQVYRSLRRGDVEPSN